VNELDSVLSDRSMRKSSSFGLGGFINLSLQSKASFAFRVNYCIGMYL